MHFGTTVVQVVESELRLNHIACYTVVFGEASDSGQEVEVRIAKVIDDYDVSPCLSSSRVV
jgi:hypothetical protein